MVRVVVLNPGPGIPQRCTFCMSPNQIHPIQVISSLVEALRPKIGVLQRRSSECAVLGEGKSGLEWLLHDIFCLEFAWVNCLAELYCSLQLMK